MEAAFRSYLLAIFAYRAGDHETALAHADRVCELDPTFRAGAAVRGELYLKLRRRTEALAQYRALLEADPTDTWIYPRLALLELTEGNPEEVTRLVRLSIGSSAYSKELDDVNRLRFKALTGPDWAGASATCWVRLAPSGQIAAGRAAEEGSG